MRWAARISLVTASVGMGCFAGWQQLSLPAVLVLILLGFLMFIGGMAVATQFSRSAGI